MAAVSENGNGICKKFFVGHEREGRSAQVSFGIEKSVERKRALVPESVRGTVAKEMRGRKDTAMSKSKCRCAAKGLE